MDEQKLNDLIESIKNLIDLLKKSPGQQAAGGLPDKGVDRLVRAMGVLSSKMDGTARTRKEEIRAAEDFSKSVEVAANRAEKQSAAVERNTQKIKDEIAARDENTRRSTLTSKQIAEEASKAAGKAAAAQNKLIADEINANRQKQASSREVFSAARNMGGGLSQLNESFLNLGGNSNIAGAGLQLLSAGASGATKAIIGYAGALQRGERGAKVSGKALEDLANPILDTISTIGTLAMFLPGLGKVFGRVLGTTAKVGTRIAKIGGAATVAAAEISKFGVKIVQSGMTQVDDLFDSFQKLSAVGMGAAGGMDDVFGMLQELGMTTGEISKFNSLLVSGAQSIKFLGATAADGAKEFSKVAGGLYKGKLGQQLMMLGVTQEEMNKLALTNMSIQARTGQLDKMSDEQRIASTAKFVKELDLAAQLTGASREQQAEAREAAMADERFRAALIEARTSGDQKEIDRLMKAQALAATAKLAGDAEAATGILQLAASGGAMTTKAATAAQQTYGINEILASNMTLNDSMKQMALNGKLTSENLAGTNKLIGTIEGFQTGVVGTANLVDKIMPAVIAAEKQGIGLEEYLKRQQEERVKTKVDEKGEPVKDTTRLMVDAARMQQNAALIMDKSLYELSSAATIHATATKMFEGAVAQFGKIVGTSPASQVTTGGAEVKAAQKAAFEAKQMADARRQAEGISGGLLTPKMSPEEIEDLAKKLYSQMPKFADGGIATGPTSGHMAMLHGTEAVIPLKGGSIPLSISGGKGMTEGPAFSAQSETNFLLEKNNTELTKISVTLSDMLKSITGVTSGIMGALPSWMGGTPPAGQPGAIMPGGAGMGPVEGGVITSEFGKRMYGGKEQMHDALDIAAKLGTPIKALERGIAVVKEEKDAQGNLKGYGKYVDIIDEKTKEVMYRMAHISEASVKTGDIVEKGQEIAKVGSTGESTGAHLHLEAMFKGQKVDPRLREQIAKGMLPTTALATGQGFGMPGMPGGLAQKYESGKEGSSAVGWDSTGGTSYGKYQLSSRRGGVTDFLKMLDQTNPQAAARLRAAGDPDAGKEGKFAQEWKSLAASGALGETESQFAQEKIYKPSVAKLSDPELKSMIENSPALKEMMKSTAIQHGATGGAGVVNAAYKKGMSPQELVDSVYKQRATQFGGSTEKERASVQNRFIQEKGDVLAMLGMPGQGVTGLAGGPRAGGPRAGVSLQEALAGQPGMIAPGQPMVAGAPGGAPGAISSDLSTITQALQAQTAATQTAITTGMQDLTTRLVDKIGPSAPGGADPAVPTLLGDILTASREQTSAINRLIQVQTS